LLKLKCVNLIDNDCKDAVERMEEPRQMKSKLKRVKTKELELNRIKESSDQTKMKAEDSETKILA
jgi:hypothetical protein